MAMKHHGSKVSAKGQNRGDSTQTAGKHFSAELGGVSKDSKRSAKHVKPDPGAYTLMPKKHVPSQARMPYSHPKQGVFKTGC